MAKRKTIDGEIGGERVVRRSTRSKSGKEEPILEEKPVKAKATKAKATVTTSPTKDSVTEGDKKEGKVCVIYPSHHLFYFLSLSFFHPII